MLIGNPIKHLPKEIGQLSQLETLNLAYCSQLKELPKEIGQLKKLNLINLTGTGIKLTERNNIEKLLPKTVIIYKPSDFQDGPGELP